MPIPNSLYLAIAQVFFRVIAFPFFCSLAVGVYVAMMLPDARSEGVGLVAISAVLIFICLSTARKAKVLIRRFSS